MENTEANSVDKIISSSMLSYLFYLNLQFLIPPPSIQNPTNAANVNSKQNGVSLSTPATPSSATKSPLADSNNPFRQNPSLRHNHKRLNFEIHAAKLSAGQRGRHKDEEFMKKLQKKSGEEEKRRMPVAQGRPKTTDKPEILVKPPVKESTKPVNLMLHSDTRAMERAEFDNQAAKKMNLIEQYRVEMERQQRLEEEEEIRRLRKELVPKAQPMPYFDRPFIPRRSVKSLTIPKEPKFHLPQHKKIKCYMS